MLTRDIKKDEIITYDAVDLPDSLLLELRKIQDKIFPVKEVVKHMENAKEPATVCRR